MGESPAVSKESLAGCVVPINCGTGSEIGQSQGRRGGMSRRRLRVGRIRPMSPLSRQRIR